MIAHLDEKQTENMTELMEAILSLGDMEECRAFFTGFVYDTGIDCSLPAAAGGQTPSGRRDL